MKVATRTQIPQASDESIVKYDAKWGSCNCPDYTHRGGSYTVSGDRVCKHMARQRSPQALVGPARVKALHDYQNPAPVTPVQIAAPVSHASIAWVNFLEFDPPAIDFEDPFAAFN